VGPNFNRRSLLSGGILAGTVALAGGRAEARSISREVPWTAGDANKPTAVTGRDYEFLSQAEAVFLEAAVSRLIPADDLGPGAKEAGVALFVDRQLKGAYGSAQNWYMQGPWADGAETQGYQSRMTPAQLYSAAIEGIDDHCRKTFAGQITASSRTRC